MTFKLKHELRGGHVHIAVFSGPDRDHLGKCGDLVMRAEEWPEFRDILARGVLAEAKFGREIPLLLENLADRRTRPNALLYPIKRRV